MNLRAQARQRRYSERSILIAKIGSHPWRWLHGRIGSHTSISVDTSGWSISVSPDGPLWVKDTVARAFSRSQRRHGIGRSLRFLLVTSGIHSEISAILKIATSNDELLQGKTVAMANESANRGTPHGDARSAVGDVDDAPSAGSLMAGLSPPPAATTSLSSDMNREVMFAARVRRINDGPRR